MCLCELGTQFAHKRFRGFQARRKIKIPEDMLFTAASTVSA
jgi:hypothetical protein